MSDHDCTSKKGCLHNNVACGFPLCAWGKACMQTPDAEGLPTAPQAEDVRREAWNAALKLGHYEVDKVLENGSPPETWDEAEKAVDRARRDALAAIDALTARKETER